MGTVVVNIYSKVVIPTYGITPGVFKNVSMSETKYENLRLKFYRDIFEIYLSSQDPHIPKAGSITEEAKIPVTITTLDGKVLKLNEIPEYIKSLQDSIARLEKELLSTESILTSLAETKVKSNESNFYITDTSNKNQVTRIITNKIV